MDAAGASNRIAVLEPQLKAVVERGAFAIFAITKSHAERGPAS